MINHVTDMQIQGSKQAGQTLFNLGNINYKLSIKATDDVYETTKTKALEAEEERKESHRYNTLSLIFCHFYFTLV